LIVEQERLANVFDAVTRLEDIGRRVGDGRVDVFVVDAEELVD
jgi:hypothetical protein